LASLLKDVIAVLLRHPPINTLEQLFKTFESSFEGVI